MDPSSVPHEWDLQGFEQWIDNNQFSPLWPSKTFSATTPPLAQEQSNHNEFSSSDRDLGLTLAASGDPEWLNSTEWPATADTTAQGSSRYDVPLEVACLQQTVRQLSETIKELKLCLSTIQRDYNAMKKWSVEVSATINDIQLKREGLSPLQKHFGLVLGPKYRDRVN
ncbi:hypothetical protein LTR62_003972 [Meristemomyces frigidus]|uniref:Uncharacterized protein n=1 Tax=Meristemomyces frigidus TaxID=1508187 RepID=A0AAN7TJ56_9PEZI|nr:hypothetical protein LTR62_003972 [Meristemomyces frigidus]